MKAMLKKNKKKLTGMHSGIIGTPSSGLWGDFSNLWGDISGLTGNISSGLTGDISGLTGDISDLWGNLDNCEITDEERKNGIKITDLINNQEPQ